MTSVLAAGAAPGRQGRQQPGHQPGPRAGPRGARAAGPSRSPSSSAAGAKSCWCPPARSPKACSAWAGSSAPSAAARTAGRRRGRPDGPGAGLRDRASARTACTLRRSCSRTRTWPTASAISTRARRCARCSSSNVIPIINENDTVATDEIRFGDNDTLGALVDQSDRGRCAGHPHRPARPVHARSAPRPGRRRWSAKARAGDPGAGKDGRRRRQPHRQRRHAHQGPRGQARGPQRRAHRHRLRARAATCCCGWPTASRSAPSWSPRP